MKKSRKWSEERRKAHSLHMKAYHARRKSESIAPSQPEPSLWQRLMAMVFGSGRKGGSNAKT